MKLICHLAIILVLASCAFARDPQPYDENLAINLTLLAGSTYCNTDMIEGDFAQATGLSPAVAAAILNVGGNLHTMSYNFYSKVDRVVQYLMYELKMVIYKNEGQKQFVVVFEGTHGNLQFLQELTDYGLVPFELHSIPNAYVNSYFQKQYKETFRDQLLQTLSDIRNFDSSYRVIFTGHSLGGAFATFAALDASLSNLVDPETTLLYTFGQPRCGNMEFAEAVNQNVLNRYRVVHDRDPIPHVPPCPKMIIIGACTKKENSKSYYHYNSEVWYPSSDMVRQNYKICQDEDSKCSNNYYAPSLRPMQHLWYFGIRISCDQAGQFKSDDDVPIAQQSFRIPITTVGRE